jgi:hypothetical protein
MPAEFLPSEAGLSAQNPWPGLQAFGTQDVEFFQGRKDKIQELFSLVGRATLTVFYGHSGLGKTSLLQAGLFPQLKQADFLPILLRLDHGSDPSAPPLADQVKEVIAAALAAAGIEAPAPAMDETLWAYFYQKDLEFWDERNRFVQPVLIFDQFEEIYTRGQETPAARARSEAFLAELEALTEKRPPAVLRQQLEAAPRLAQRYDYDRQTFRIVLAMREDYLPFLLKERRRFTGVGYHQCRLERMTGRDAWDVLLQPGGADLIEPATALRILQALTTTARDQPGAAAALPELTRAEVDGLEVDPALLSVTCRELNLARQRRGLSHITPALVEEIGGSILDQFYETGFEGVAPAARRFVEERLLSDSGEYRQAVAMEEACAPGGIAREDVARLVNRRLLHIEEYHGVAHLEFTHDRLTRVARKSREDRHRREAEETERQQAAQRELALRRERDKQRRRFRRLAAVAAVLLLIAAGLAGGILFSLYNYVWEHEVYYGSFVKKWGILHGGGPRLNAEQVKHNKCTLRFVYRGSESRGKLLQVEAVNGRGFLTTSHNIGTNLRTASETLDQSGQVRECRWEFVTDAAGHITYEMAFDSAHRLVWGFVYSPPSDREPRTRRAHYVGPSGFPQRQRASGAEYVTINYDENGYEIRHLFESAAGTPQKALDGAYGRRFKVNRAGQTTELTSLDTHGNPMNDAAWNATLVIEYNEKGQETGTRALDAKRQPVLTSSWEYGNSDKYDQWGNFIRQDNFGLKGGPCVDKDGIAAERTDLDEWGEAIRITFLGLDGKPCLSRSEKFAGCEVTYDGRGRKIRVAFFDPAGRPCLSNDQIAGYTYDYNSQDLIIRDTNLGLDGKPCLSSEGVAGSKFEYDEQGLEKGQAFFGEDGKPCLNTEKISGWRDEHDALGHLIRRSFFGTDGQPCLSNGDSAGWSSVFDARGQEVQTNYFGLKGEPRVNSDGEAGWRREYDEEGNEKRVTYLGLDGAAVVQPTDGAARETDYDDRGQPVGVTFLDTAGRPFLNSENIAGWHSSFDDRGLEVKRMYFDPAGKPCLYQQQYAALEHEYDPRGQLARESYLGVDGKPLLQPDGYATVAGSYDERGNLLQKSYFDASGQLCLSSEGFARMESTYNEWGFEVKRLFFDPAGKLIAGAGGFAGWTADGDAHGREVRATFLGVDGKPCQVPEGFSSRRTMYNERDEITGLDYFDVKEKPCLLNRGYASARFEFDRDGKRIGASYFGMDGKELPPVPVMLTVTKVNENSEASRVGIRTGDVLISYGGWSRFSRPLVEDGQSAMDLFSAERNKPGQGARQVEVCRGGAVVKFLVQPGLLGITLDYSDTTFAPWIDQFLKAPTP